MTTTEGHKDQFTFVLLGIPFTVPVHQSSTNDGGQQSCCTLMAPRRFGGTDFNEHAGHTDGGAVMGHLKRQIEALNGGVVGCELQEELPPRAGASKVVGLTTVAAVGTLFTAR